MGLLDQVIGGVLGGGTKPQGGSGSGTSPLVKALLLLLAAKAANTYIHHGAGSATPAPTGGPATPPSGTIESGMMAGLPSLDSLLDKLRGGGHADTVDSWIGNGTNKPLAPKDLETTLGPDTVDQLQTQTGMGRDQMLSQLSQYLPQIIDKLSPGGRMPGPADRGHW